MEKNQEKNKILEIFFLKFGIPLKYLNQKSKLCVHPDGCLENILKGAGRSFKYGYLIRMMISVFGALFHIKNKKKPAMTILQSIFATDNWSFAVFLALFPLVNKTLLCGLRNYREKNSEKQDFITGTIAGCVSIAVLPHSLRFLLTLYLLTRALEALYRNFLSKNVIKLKYDYAIVFALACSFIGYAFSFEPDLMPPGLVKIYLRFANMDKNDAFFREAWIEMAKRRQL